VLNEVPTEDVARKLQLIYIKSQSYRNQHDIEFRVDYTLQPFLEDFRL
jgi:hypothetical protein